MPMGHTVRGKSKLLARVRRIRGQVEALERALEAEKSCSDILHQIAAVRGAINGLMSNVLEDHIQTHVANPAIEAVERAQGADELIDVIRTYLK
jgi:DNA-binding FrmR family transcriptional regulator